MPNLPSPFYTRHRRILSSFSYLPLLDPTAQVPCSLPSDPPIIPRAHSSAFCSRYVSAFRLPFCPSPSHSAANPLGIVKVAPLTALLRKHDRTPSLIIIHPSPGFPSSSRFSRQKFNRPLNFSIFLFSLSCLGFFSFSLLLFFSYFAREGSRVYYTWN